MGSALVGARRPASGQRASEMDGEAFDPTLPLPAIPATPRSARSRLFLILPLE